MIPQKEQMIWGGQMDKYQGLSVSARCAESIGQRGVSKDCVLIRQTATCQILTISTGEDGKQYFRSHIGACFAAEAALESMDVFASSVSKEMLFTDKGSESRLLRQLAGSIITGWRDRVKKDIEACPFRPEEISSVENIKYKENYKKGIDQEYAYRANVAGAVVARDYCLIIRNGDSECTVVETAFGTSDKLTEPVPWNKRCREYYSTSLCDMTAIREFRYCCLDVVPAAVFLVSGSLRRCFNRTEVYHIYLEQMALLLLENGTTGTKYLKKNLLELSQRGTHEDVCLVCAWSANALGNCLKPRQRQACGTDQQPSRRAVYFLAGTCILLLSIMISFMVCVFFGR